MTPKTRYAFRKSSAKRTKALSKLRIQKLLTNKSFHDFYTIPKRINIDDAYTRCLYKRRATGKDCGNCQDCGFIYTS